MSKVESLEIAQIIKPDEGPQPLLETGNLGIIKDVKIKLEVVVGDAEMTVDELLNLGKGSVVKLTRSTKTPVDLLVDGKIVARGHLVAADDNFGIQISELKD